MTRCASILVVFDQVRHFHLPLFEELEKRMDEKGIELHLCRGEEAAGSARGSVERAAVRRETRYRLRDHRIGSYTFRLGLGYLAEAWRLRPQVVICPAHPGNFGHWCLAVMKRLLGYRLVSWQCGYEYNPGRLKNLLVNRFVPFFDHHLAYHGNARRYCLDHGAREDQITVTHNTIDERRIERLSKDEARREIEATHPQLNGRKIVLHVGALLEEKRLEPLIDAISGLDRTDVALVIIGDGPHRQALEAHAAGHPSVVFTGRIVEGVGAWFDAATVYVLPGTGGLGINEAMAHGLPIISGYADGSADDLVVDGENGFRLREGTVEEISDRIVRILDDPEMAAEMSARSREWITGKFSFERFIARIEGALVELVGRGGSPRPLTRRTAAHDPTVKTNGS